MIHLEKKNYNIQEEKMEFKIIQNDQWAKIKKIYLEAFPKRERKPFCVLRHSVKTGKAQIFTVSDQDTVIGFTVVIPYRDMVMVDYLAVSQGIRSKGTGSYIMQKVCKQFSDRRILLLIERLDDQADNREQRIARRKFYFKNGFSSSELFIKGASGDMEILTFGGKVSPEEYLILQRYALGNLLFHLSKIDFAA